MHEKNRGEKMLNLEFSVPRIEGTNLEVAVPFSKLIERVKKKCCARE